jgi:hypothetical protein
MKLSAKELRIGNLLQGEPLRLVNQGIYSDGVFAITGFGISELEIGHLWKADPIPLTEEWLVRFGFKKVQEGVIYILWENDGLAFYWDKVSHGISSIYNCGHHHIRIDTVHQLQNLFWCLCGEELEIKELIMK